MIPTDKQKLLDNHVLALQAATHTVCAEMKGAAHVRRTFYGLVGCAIEDSGPESAVQCWNEVFSHKKHIGETGYV